VPLETGNMAEDGARPNEKQKQPSGGRGELNIMTGSENAR